jgi:hypothetical protein
MAQQTTHEDSVQKDMAIETQASHVEHGGTTIILPVDADGKALPFNAGRPIVSPDDEQRMKRLRWKLDLWILPLLTLIMLLSSMDRSDVSTLMSRQFAFLIGPC